MSIKEQLKKLEHKALSGDDILKAIGSKAKLMTYPEIADCRSIKDVLGKYDACVILFETKENFGHWTCVYQNDSNVIDFFDSYGLKPDNELKFIPAQFRTKSNQAFTHLTDLLYKSGCDVEYNHTRLQASLTGVNTCGRWVVARLLLRDMPLANFVKFFKSKLLGLSPDQLVTYLTAKI